MQEYHFIYSSHLVSELATLYDINTNELGNNTKFAGRRLHNEKQKGLANPMTHMNGRQRARVKHHRRCFCSAVG